MNNFAELDRISLDESLPAEPLYSIHGQYIGPDSIFDEYPGIRAILEREVRDMLKGLLNDNHN